MKTRRFATAFNNLVIRKIRDRIELEVAGGSFGSWHPRCILTAYYWDALAAGCLLHPTNKNPNILILGLGGGTVVRIIKHILPKAKIVAIEIDGELVDIARKYMHLQDYPGLEIVIEDAYRYLNMTNKRFDVIIDDIFQTGPEDVYRPEIDPVDVQYLVKRCLKSGGIALTNLVTDPDHRQVQSGHRQAYKSAYDVVQILHPKHGANEILVGGISLKSWRAIQGIRKYFTHPSDRKWWRAITIRTYH